eukprot:scaffold1062_cov130-Cylindrotheca_fusiformis.AAC.14
METPSSRPWIRGVNIGGWLLMERWITPYLFAVTSCHTAGDYCWYPGQISAPPISSPDHEYCDLYQCKPKLIDSVSGGKDFPTDEYTLSSSFDDKLIAEKYFSHHWDNFVTKDDVIALSEVGVTHVRVPVPHWIMGDIKDDEPWIGGRWLFFIRFVSWCRQYGIEVWIDIHTAPGSQNGFDNSGILLEGPTCQNWSGSDENVARSLDAVHDIAKAIVDDGLGDVVTGFGFLNEPFSDCDRDVMRIFNQQAFETVRNIMGQGTHVFMGDMFNATKWNDGWWTDSEHKNTYIDSHYYHVFGERTRALSPKQHIGLLCAQNARDTASCCYEDAPKNKKVSQGISHIVGEWSASYDRLPVEKLKDVMKSIQEKGEALELNRTMSQDRKKFLRNFVQAQMSSSFYKVTYESAETRTSSGWFYWTLKTEGGAFAEWNFLLGVKQGWILNFPPKEKTSESIYGKCEEIAAKTRDDESIINEFPDPNDLPSNAWLGEEMDDDYVLSHAASLGEDEEIVTSNEIIENDDDDFNRVDDDQFYDDDETKIEDDDNENSETDPQNNTSQDAGKGTKKRRIRVFPLFVIGFFCYAIYRVFFSSQEHVRFRHQYTSVDRGFETGTGFRV